VLAAFVLALGGAKTYFSYYRTETEHASLIGKNPLLRVLRHVYRDYLGQIYRELFVAWFVRLCADAYCRFEVGVLDKLNYATASATLELSDLLFKHGELAGIDKLNHIIAVALSSASTRLILKLDIVGDYYAAIAWFVGGAVISLVLLLLA